MPHLILNKRTLYYRALVLVSFDTANAGFHLLTGPSARLDDINIS